MAAEAAIQKLVSLLSKDETIRPGDPSYEEESKTWSAGKNLHPKLIVRPASIESLSTVVKHLSQSSLKFDVRESGVGSSSSEDVVILTRAFNDFEFDRENELVTLGAGALWSEYYEQMEKVAPEYTGNMDIIHSWTL